MSLGSRINEIRREKNISIDELCERSGVPKGTLSKITAGITSSPTLDTVRAIAEALECRLDDFDDNPQKADYLAAAEHDLIKKYRSLDPYGKEAVDSILVIECKRCMAAKVSPPAENTAPQATYIKHYLVPAAAGYASPIEGEDYELVVRGADVPAKADFCLDISGDSMLPYIKDGQTVYVQRGADLEELDVGIFFVDGDVFCKQWCVDYAGTLHLLSANPKRQDANISISRSSGRSCVCFGKVLLDKKLPRPVYL